MLMTDTEIARVTYEVNRAYCAAHGDHSFGPWEDAPDWQRESNVQGVIFHRAKPGAHPSESHNNWMAEKLVAGWTYGEIKDPERKQHPCMVPYETLPIEQRVKDYLFTAIVSTLD